MSRTCDHSNGPSAQEKRAVDRSEPALIFTALARNWSEEMSNLKCTARTPFVRLAQTCQKLRVLTQAHLSRFRTPGCASRWQLRALQHVRLQRPRLQHQMRQLLLQRLLVQRRELLL